VSSGSGGPGPASRLTAADLLALGLVVAAFSWIAFRNIRQPGLYGDEAWMGVSAARFAWGAAPAGLSPWKIRVFGHVLPTMLNSYVGPVKGYILAAAFSFFGVSVPVLRGTTASVGLLGVVALYFLARQQFGRLAAAASTLLLATDLSFVLAVRCDWGPVDFAFFARVAAILLLLSWQRNRGRRRLLFLASLLLGLGLSFKLDFLGTIAAVVVAWAVFYGVRFRPRSREAALAAGGFLLGS
jgi:4-amino-4-deoxy-L-arabinose transferase-like glycosyltransferase